MMSKPNSVDLAFAYRGFCCDIRTATFSIGVYYLVTSLLVCIDMILGLVKGKDMCGFIHTQQYTNGERIFDTTTNFFLIAVMIISSVYVLFGVRKYRPRLLLPFIILLVLDISLCVMSLFSGPWGLPGTLTYEEALMMWDSVGVKHELSNKEIARLTLIFGITFVMYLLIKVYMVNCVIKCYSFIKAHNTRAKDTQTTDEKSAVVVLPSYDEALKLPFKELPPTYQEPSGPQE
ncbi:lysosomal-associated transmembrane protein 5 [Lepisosteus oculatus]|uniref:Lysosomal protein transmembrane 5 n=1 Tax=Lepisosteus oculatus TaxID=7918 RepID=W5MCU0_LEPOC|nr:PREDICTED: lysosomal-associated transmembrane protein 5 [Lepisosteus oculatus]